MGCNDNSSRGRDYDGEEEAQEMRRVVRRMSLSNFTVEEFELVQELLDRLEFHRQENGMKRMREIIERYSTSPGRPNLSMPPCG